ncbi:MAG TPA: ATP-binding protein, partial [Methanomassiliicoccales archaeon]|nr:ATP-binding protein [Methanomassiliicoccales archaeon]
TEFKTKVQNWRDISETVCAFANGQGGVIVIGANDSGEPIGLSDDIDQAQQRASSAVRAVSPAPYVRIDVIGIDAKAIRMEVMQLGQSLFCTLNGLVYIRSGSTNMKLEGASLQEFLVRRSLINFDTRLTEDDIDSLDMDKVLIFLRRRNPGADVSFPDLTKALAALGVYHMAQRRVTNAGMIFFGKNTARSVPQNEMRLVRFKGIDHVNVIDKQFLNDTISDMVEHAQSFIERNTRSGMIISGLRRIDVPEYPKDVLREALVNAIAHRDYLSPDAIHVNIYDDRLEIINPGSLIKGMSLEDLGSMSAQRNPTIYRMMRDIGMVEGLGLGIPRMRALLRKEEYPEPRFETKGEFFKFILYNKTAIGMNPRQVKVLGRMREEGSTCITTQQYMVMTKVSKPQAINDLNQLSASGRLVRMGRSRQTRYELP